MGNWYEDDKLWEKFYDWMFDDDSFELAKEQVPQLLSLVNHPIESVLDLGCGPGRHCLALAQMGYTVTGLDMSQFLLDKAKKKAKDMSLNVTFVQADMLNYEVGKKQDLIVNMFNSFGYFDTPEKNQQVINNAYHNLKTIGTFIIDTVGKETLARNIEPVHLSEHANGDLRIERPLLIDNLQIFSNEWILVSGDKAFKRSYQHYVYTPIELTTMCIKSGFDSVQVYGNLNGEEYDLDSDRLIVVAEKYEK
ncbi:MAG: methyltransferase domain-containing protein [Proteobacteria bacterium]|nr:methyltransferase domain-containing protein [Pseudomonadota bacterium]